MTTQPPTLGTPLALDGAHPLDLSAAAQPLFVRSGLLNVFAQGEGGRRHFLFQCGAGELVFGLPPVCGRPVLAMATLGTVVEELTGSAVFDMIAPAEREALLAGWQSRLGLPGEAFDPSRAAARFDAMLAQRESERAGSIASGWKNTTSRYQRALGTLARIVREGGGRADSARPQESDAAMAGPAAAAAPAGAAPPAAVPEADASPALQACRRVAAALGAEFDPGPTPDAGLPLDELLVLAGMRGRTVLLRGDWWRTDNGPLIGFDGETRTPVALLRAGRGYQLVRPDGATTRVDAECAAALAAEAVMLYRPLKAGETGGLALLRLCAGGLGHDLRALLRVGLAASMLALAVPVATGWLVSSVLPRGAVGEHWQLVALLLAAAFGAAGFELCKGFLLLRCEARVDLTLQAALFDRLLRLPVGFFRKYSVADLTDRALGIQEMRNLLSSTVVGALLGAVFSVSSLAAMLFYSPRLAAVGLGVVAVVLLLTVYFARVQLRHEAEQVRQRGLVEGLVLQFVLGIGKLRAAAAESRALAAWALRYGEQKRRVALARRAALVQELVQSCVPATAGLLVFAAIHVSLREGNAPGTGTLLAFLAAYGQFLAAMTGMTLALTQALGAAPLWKRLQPLLREAPEDGGARQRPGALRGAIAFQDVSFSYGDTAILHGVSLSIEPGQFVAIVGPSGSGKSTLMRLMMGFEQPASGAILFDGVPLARMDAAALRRRIGVVLQNGRVASGSVFSNIAAGQHISHDEAMEAARQVGFAHEIEAMPMGLHTVLQDGGGSLSGGQRQRLLMARALARRPALLLLDEATSALDNRTQSVLMESLERLALTRVMVAHRLSTVVRADQILVLDAGRVVQRGTYDELMAQPGLFAELARRQLL